MQRLCQLLVLVVLIPHTQSFVQSTRKPQVVNLEAWQSSSKPTLRSNQQDNTRPGSTSTGFYVHIPYCRRRCRYCDFAIVPIGSDTNERQTDGFLLMDARYRNALLQEIDSLNNKDIDDENDNRTLSSIYFGGGTPSLAPLETIQAILDAIRRRFHVDKDTVEITMEMDPGTFDEVQLRHLADIGVNRISLGVQALDDAVLEQIGRVHRVQDIHESIRMIRRVFVGDNNNHNDDHEAPNFSIDLISGLPGVSLSAWANALEMAVYDLKPSHISIYDLQIEKGTVFGRWYDDEASIVKSTSPPRTKGRSFLPSPDDCAYMYRYASGYLRNEGFEHYEISSYARAGKRSRHNQVYWGYQTEWFAIGLGSTSYLNHHRCARPRAMSDYLEWVKQQSSEPEWLRVANNDPAIPASRDPERLADIVLTRLRTIDGLDLDWLQCAYGESVVDAVLKGAQLALDLGLANINNRILSLNDPKGFLFSNSILSNIFVELPDTPG